ncbi:MAG: nicotinate-nucleotide diphosphorylase (carboxylating), partial [Planctomycetota bacterium]
DNMAPPMLREGVAMRDSTQPGLLLEASGGVDLDTIGDIARTGVDRISVGSLTHGATWLDVGMDAD